MSVISDLLTASGIGDLQAAMLAVFVLFLVPYFFVLYLTRRRGELPVGRLRRIGAYESLKQLLARASETGQPVHISVGTAGVGGARTAETTAGLSTLEYLADRAAVTGAPPIVTVTEPTALPAVLDQLRRAYERQGYPEEFDPQQARLLAPPVNNSAVPYAAGVMELLGSEEVLASVMVGSFGDEYLLMTEPGAQRKLLQVGGSSNLEVLPLVQLTMSHPVIGEEIYAAGAYLNQRARQISSLLAQDLFRVGIVLVVLLVIAARLLGLG